MMRHLLIAGSVVIVWMTSSAVAQQQSLNSILKPVAA
jgi:hypothetical protein